MPTYQYACTECGHSFEQVQSFTDDSLTVCPVCEGKLRKVYNAVGVVFKGSGFYHNDSRPSGSSGESSGGDSGKGSDSSGGSSGSGSSGSAGEKKADKPAEKKAESTPAKKADSKPASSPST